MKKLFTLFAFLTCFLGAKAIEITDFTVDYTQVGTSAIGWKGDVIQDEWITADEDGLHLLNPEPIDPWYSYQLWIFSGAQLEVGTTYTVKIVAKVSDGSATVRSRVGDWGGGISGDIIVNSTDYQEYTITGEATASPSGLLVQFGDYAGTVSFKSVTITHEGKEERPVTWQQWLTDDGNSIIPEVEHTNKYLGDAETPWPAWSLELTDGINANWRQDRTGEICAWSLTMGRNFDDQNTVISEDSPRSRPYPSDIMEDPDQAGNHIFVVNVTTVDPIDTDGSIAWANQFWIQSPKGWKSGTKIKIKFRYKADVACNVGTQIHKQHPSDYLFYNAVGDVSFTTQWQEFEKTLDISSDTENGWSLAFNLNSDATNGRTPNKFYFDDLSWETMVLDEGYFVAGSNSVTGIEYDLDNATEFMQAEDDPDLVYAQVGQVGKQDSWVNEIMISTVRGNNTAFKGATLKPSGSFVGEDQWGDYTESSNAKIKLNAAGVYQIFLDTKAKQINMIKLEGEAEKDPVDIIANDQEIVIEATERQPTSGEEEGGTGNTWDNQFFLYSNRNLAPGEETVLEFEYKATTQAKSTAAFQGIVAGNPDYITGAFDLDNDDAFDTEWKSVKKELTMPAKKWDGTAVDAVTFITFDLACMKEANTYTFKNIKWYMKGDENAEGKTLENLINATGAENFAIKIGAGTDPVPMGIEAVVDKAKTGSTATYNLAGQRISKEYKGIVIKDGKKVVVK
jgi:hypothetical protein